MVDDLWIDLFFENLPDDQCEGKLHELLAGLLLGLLHLFPISLYFFLLVLIINL